MSELDPKVIANDPFLCDPDSDYPTMEVRVDENPTGRKIPDILHLVFISTMPPISLVWIVETRQLEIVYLTPA